MSGAPRSPLALFAKAALDRTAAACGLLLAAPLIGAAALAIRLEGKGPVFFTQDRPGLGGRVFRVAKLRTMREANGPDGKPLPDEVRLTPLGAFLRKSSLDELPQLWNVLKGDLSLVGPRPLLVRYLPRYSARQARRHEVMPGITGWAQVNGRNAISWAEKFELDVWYVDHWSFWLDLEILGLTALRLVRPRGISQQGHATMPEFFGDDAGQTNQERA
jgi:lipopolysaccharide/colanic/teichoic acid biosynthesis glycosyltransferase